MDKSNKSDSAASGQWKEVPRVELKRVWLEALRSGDYKQCQDTLHNFKTGGFCCLGVAAHVWGVASKEDMGVEPNSEGFTHDEGPPEIYDTLRSLVDRYIVEKAVNMNDRGKPFSVIADMLETEWQIVEQ